MTRTEPTPISKTQWSTKRPGKDFRIGNLPSEAGTERRPTKRLLSSKLKSFNRRIDN